MFQDFSVSGLAIDRCITWTCSHLRQDLLEANLVIFGHSSLTRSLPRDIHVRCKKDHPGGQGRIYTSNLNFVSTHVKARPPTWLLLQVSEVSSSSVRWSLLALLGLVHCENSSSMLCAVFVQMAGNSVVDVSRFNRSWSELYVWWLSLRQRSSWPSSGWKLGRREWRWRLAGRRN